MTADEWLRVVAAGLQAISIAATAAFAIAGLDVWRRQMVGKRKMELAETTIAAFYKAREAISRVRSPFGFQGEGSKRPREEGETPEQSAARDGRYATIQRLKDEQPIFDGLQAQFHLARIYFGKEAITPFTDVRSVVHTVYIAGSNLVRGEAEPEGRRYRRENLTKWEEIVWEGLAESADGTDGPDPLAKKVDAAVAKIEALCTPSLQTPPAAWPIRWLLRD